MKRWKICIIELFVASFLIFTVACEPPDNTPTNPDPGTGTCDRECLIGVLDGYLDAIVAHDPSLLNLAAMVKYTDNGVKAQLGEGLWQTAVGLDNDKRLDFADPVQGNVATQMVIYETNPNAGDEDNSGGCDGSTGDTSPVIYQLRLKVEQHQITEIEAMTLRRINAAGFFVAKNLAPEPVFLEPIAPEKRMSRDEMKAILDLYVDYLEGTKNGSEVPFDKKCKRYENGIVTASGLAMFKLQSFWFFNVTRRYPVIDEETGIIWGMLPFFQTNNSLVVGEAFKIMDGKIMMIQAVMNWQPSKAWD